MTTATTTGLRVSVLGPLLVVREAGAPVELGGPKQRAVLAMLAASPGRVVLRDRVLEGVWGEESAEAHRGSFHTYLSNLRGILGDVIVREGAGYRLDLPPKDVDSVAFEETVDGARSLIATNPGSAASRLREALALWRGLPFADLLDVPGLQGEIRRLEELRVSAVELRIDAELAAGRHDVVVSEVEALAEEHPTRERFRAQHMLALYRAGRQAEALAAYRRTEAHLREELGLEPSAELRDLELKILGQDPELAAGVARATTQRLAFLVTDIEGSARAWDANSQAMAEALAVHDRILREAIEEAGGRAFKHTGDGVLAVFADASSAVAAAEASQRALTAADWGDVGELRVRMGIDIGEAEARGGDFYGPPLNRAARLCAVAHGGQVLISGSGQGELAAAAPVGVQIRQLGEHRLRGLATPERVAQLVFVGLPAEFPNLRLDSDLASEEPLMPSLPGYELRDRLGEGAFGVVYRAYQPSVGREVAVKVIRPSLASHPAFVRRFEAEARTIARLAHPHIVPLIDFWRDPEGAYLVLQLLPGGSLRDVLAGGVDRGAARRILLHVGEALDHAHGQGVVHGDLQPANVLLDGAGNTYLSDFGIAARLIDPQVVASVSSAPAFRAPEERSAGPSQAADRFAFGMLARHLLGDEPDLEEVLARATAAHPGDRYPSAAALLTELDEALGGEPAEVERPIGPRNPYKGLRAFEESDAPDFYGRDELVATLVAAAERHRFVTVVGPSGSGKSSAVQAGLLPALAVGGVAGSEQWFRAVLTPGPRPLESLFEALEAVAPEPVDLLGWLEGGDLAGAADRLLAETAGELLLVVDQFEELFTLVDSPERRQAFIDLLVDAVERERTRVRVVATLRADFYDRPLAHDHLDRLVRDGLVTVLRPTREELVEIISRPAQAVGLRWEPGLPHHIAQDVVDQPGGLPLLQYALTELVERRRADRLTDDDYRRIGGVAGALAARAEGVFGELSAARQEAARQVLLRLVTVDEEADATRRRVRRSELESLGIDRADLEAVLRAFTAERLLLGDRDPVTRGPTVEVAHEALLREWPRLRSWIEDQREALILGRRLRGAMAEWEAAERDEDYLLTGSRLAPFLGGAESSGLSADERAFLEASKEKDEAERAARARRRRVLTGVLATATVVAVGLASLAFAQSRRATAEAERALAAEQQAETEAELAESAAQLARSRELAASAINALGDDSSLAKLLALSAASIADPPLEVISALHRAYAADPVVARYAWPEGGSHWSDLHPSGRLVVASGATPFDSANYLEVADLTTGDVLWSYRLEEAALSIGPSYFSPDGERVVAGVYWEPTDEGPPVEDFRHLLGAHIWDTETGELIDRFDLGRCGGIVVDLSATHLAVRTRADVIEGCWALPNPFGSPEFEVGIELIDISSDERKLLSSKASLFYDNIASLSGDGRFVGFEDLAANPPVAVVLDMETGEPVLEYDPLATGATNPALRQVNQDGSLLLEGARPTQVWDVPRGEVVASFDIGLSPFAVFGPSGRTVYSTDRDGALRHWDAMTGEELWVVRGVGSGRVSVTDGGLVLVSDPEAGEAALVDTRVRGEIAAVETCRGGWLPAAAGSLNVAGGVAAFQGACTDQPGPFTAHVIDLEEPALLHTIPDVVGQVIRLSPEGTRLVSQDASGALTGPIVVRDVGTGATLVELEGLCRWDQALTLSGIPRVETGDCRPYPEPPFPIWAWHLEWSPDGTFIAAVDDWAGESYLAVWDAATGRLLFTGETAGFMTFTTDSQELVMSPFGERTLVAVSTETWEVVRQAPLNPSLEGGDALDLAGYSPDGRTLLGVGGMLGRGGGALHWFDAETLELVRSKTRIHEGSPKTMALSPTRSLLATGASDGFVRVWDAETGTLVHEIPLGDTEVQGVAFVNERHLAVTPQEGNLLIFTIDTDELVEIVRSSLTRGFTETECERFNFGHDCPTLEELREG